MRALILVDIQNDFVPGGALAVPDGDQVVPVANRLIPTFELVVATQDWHPQNHGSFASNHGKEIGEVIEFHGLNQILWPDHCVQNTRGAEFVADLDIGSIGKVFTKGTAVEVDSYSGFFDNGHRNSTGLTDYLRTQSVDEVHVMGLATDYCVKFTTLDAISEGFRTLLIDDGCRGVNLQPGDVDRAVEEMTDAGVTVIQSSEVQPE